MSGWRGILSGALALIALETLVRPSASTRVAGLFGVPAAVARRFLDPSVPAIPDLRKPESDKGNGDKKDDDGWSWVPPIGWANPFG